MSGSTASLRRATADDAQELLRLIHGLAEYERLAHEVQATAADLSAALLAAPPRVAALLAEVDGRAIGFALWFHTYSTFTGKPGLYLEDIFVEPAYRGRGIGRAIFRHLARHAMAEGCARFEWAVLDWNEPALSFYASLGAEPMAEWTVQRLAGPALARLAA